MAGISEISPRVPGSYRASSSSKSMDIEFCRPLSQSMTTKKSRRTMSAATLDSDLLEIISWAALIDIPTSCSQHQSIPSDVSGPEESEVAFIDTSVLSRVFDRTTLDISFDHTCIDGLDEALLYSPTSAFASICWEHAVQDSPRLAHSTKRTRSNDKSHTHNTSYLSSDDSDSDSDECVTFIDDIPVLPTFATDERHTSPYLSEELPAFAKGKSLFPDDNASFMLLEPRFNFPNNPNESIACFPVSSGHRSKSRRIADFCSKLPSKFVKPVVT